MLKYQWKKDGNGDAFDPVNNRIIEVKESGSHKKDFSSFSPSESFAELIFVKVDKDEDKSYIYETGISSDDLKLIQDNTTETVGDQQADNRRPRFSIESKIIAEKGLKPSYELGIMAKTITKLK